MTISISINGDFHRSVCPSRVNNHNCSNNEMQLSYRCSKCFDLCLKCEKSRLNTNSPYARGCEEARQAVSRTFSCVCTDCEL